MTDANENKALARRLYEEVLNGRDVAALDGLVATDHVENDPLPGQGSGLDGFRQRVSMLQALDPRFTIQDIVAEDDKVVVRWTNAGTHVGEFLGLPATGRSFVIAGVDIHRIRDGRLAEHWHVIDQLGLLVQLGVIAPPGGEGAQ